MARVKRLTRESIIQGAFKEWAKSRFTSTSLSDLARSLTVSKTALYRHFRNKNTLLESMRKTFFEDIGRVRDNFLEKTEHSDLKEAIFMFFSLYIPFFMKQPAYFHFSIHLIIRELQCGKEEPEFFLRESSLLTSLMQSAGIEREKHKILLRYIFAVGSFWVFQSLREKRTWPDREIGKVTEKCSALVTYGIQNGKKHHEPDTRRIFEECALSTGEIEPPDRIFSAIAEVVADVGLQNATTEMIARRIGISKSSLYFYFENKDEMLEEMVRRQQQHFLDLFKERERRYSTIEEKLFCYMATLSSFLMNNPTILTVFNWTWLQGIEVKAGKPDLSYIENVFDFLRKGFDTGRIRKMMEIRKIIILASRLSIQEIGTGLKNQEQEPYISERVGHMFTLLLGGIENFTDNRSTQR